MENNFSDINQIWNSVIIEVKKLDVDDSQKVDAFLPLLKPQAISQNFLMLTANNTFIKFWVEGHILDLIKKALFNLYNTEFNIQIEIDQTSNKFNENQVNNINQNNVSNVEIPNLPNPQSINESFVAANLISSNSNLNTDPASIFTKSDTENSTDINNDNFNLNLASLLTFENFVIGNSNNIAYQMAKAVSVEPGKPNLNPLFIYGKSGVGKTHLLHAIKNHINRTNPSLNVIYIDATAFVNEYTEAATAHDIDKKSFLNFQHKYENAAVLLIDDLQLLQNKTSTLNTFFSIFNNITNMGRQIVISADRAPKNIDVDERYQSRFNNGMSCEITSPEVEVKLGIIKSYIEDFKSEEPDIDNYINNDVKYYIAENSSSNIRELKSAVTKVLYDIKFNHQQLSVENVKSILDEHFSKSIKKRVTVANIQKQVESFYNISHSALIGKKKDRNIAYARQIAMYLCYKLLDITLSSIGKEFNRDHSTVLHSVNIVEEKLKSNRSLFEELENLQKLILEKD